jgi:hypothetical protein
MRSASAVEVRFRPTDLEYEPLAGVPVRLVLGPREGEGPRFVTDERGEHRFAARAVIRARWRKLPTSFWLSLVTLPQRTDQLAVAAGSTTSASRGSTRSTSTGPAPVAT